MPELFLLVWRQMMPVAPWWQGGQEWWRLSGHQLVSQEVLADLTAPERLSSHQPIIAQKPLNRVSPQHQALTWYFLWGFVGCSHQKYIVYWRCEQIPGAGPPGENCKEQQRADVRHDPLTSDGCNFKKVKNKTQLRPFNQNKYCFLHNP